MPGYWLGIDLGTTSTAAAICRPAAGGLEVQVVPLSSQSYAMPSVLFLPGDGSLLVGEEAQRRSLTDPYRVVREFKSRMGDEIPLLVGGAPFYAHDLAAEFVSSLCQHVTRQEGEPPQTVALTCPASWGPDKTALFERAVQHTGVPNVTTLTEPQAAAIGYAGRANLPPGATVAVYDLGAARFDVAVLRQDAQDTFAPLGRSEGIAGLGGLSFDEVIFEYVCAAAGVPLEEMDLADHGLAAEVAQLRRECAEAKETLSASYDAIISVTLGGAQHWVRLTRAELEEMIRPDLDRTIEAMHRAFGSADVVAGELDAILLTGGSARIPLVAQLIAAEFGRPPIVDADPKVVVAAGAARFAAPAGSPVRDLGTLPADAAGERRSGPIALLRHPSRKALLGAAALAVLVVGGAVTALRTPVLSDLTSHHGNGGGTVASGGAPSTSGSGSPTPSAQSSAKPTGKASGTKSAATSNGPVAAGPSSVAAAAAQSSNPVTNPSKTTKASPTKAPVKTKAPTAAPTSAKPAPSPTTSTPTPSPSTSSPVPSPSSSSTTSTPPAASADPSSATPSTSATATT
ncbi:MAG TPA: Hsp70 family protein [Streptosporangiaceae bacterium]|jgi:actin-like ATPase involved in cell morphogenesis|nr:Hsp70 family protein [Streptosporangiaceae bacterium]